MVVLWAIAGLVLVLTLAFTAALFARIPFLSYPGRAVGFAVDTAQRFFALAARNAPPEGKFMAVFNAGDIVRGVGDAAGAVASGVRRARFEPGPGAPCAHCTDGPCADCARAAGGGPAFSARTAPGPAFRRTPAPPAEDPLGRLAAYSRRVRAEELDGLAGAPPARPSDREHVPLSAPGLLATADAGPRLEWAGPAPAATFVPDHYALSL